MSTHAGALLLPALADGDARISIESRFTSGTGKLGVLAGFTSAVARARSRS